MTHAPHEDQPKMGVRSRKQEWRRRILAARRALPHTVRAERAEALVAQVPELAANTSGPVCAYVPIGTEPGSIAWVDALRDAGHNVLLPIVTGKDTPLDWARYEGPESLRPGPLGLSEPTTPRLGSDAISQAQLVLIPALAADQHGVRLGRGAGHYDRTLPLAAPRARLVVVLNPEELVDELPAEPHDRRVHAALLAGVGVTPLGANP